LIELDGRQRIVQVQNWSSPEETQTRDIYKMKLANNHGYSVIRIEQEDVWYNRNNWDIEIYKHIKEYDTVTNIFIGNMYDQLPNYKYLENKPKIKFIVKSPHESIDVFYGSKETVSEKYF
jgi:hypothetical protein